MPTVYVIVTKAEGCELNEQSRVEELAGGAVRRLSVQLTGSTKHWLSSQLDCSSPDQKLESVSQFNRQIRRNLSRPYWQYRQHLRHNGHESADLFLVIDGERVPNGLELAFHLEDLIYLVRTDRQRKDNQISIRLSQVNSREDNGRRSADQGSCDPIDALFQTGPIIAYARTKGVRWQPVTKNRPPEIDGTKNPKGV